MTLPDEIVFAICVCVTRKGMAIYGQPQPRARSWTTRSPTIHADGAGLHKRVPRGCRTRTSTFPRSSPPRVTPRTNYTAAGHDITITLTATNYTWAQGSGLGLTTTGPGMLASRRHGPQHRPEVDPPLLPGWRSMLDIATPTRPRNHVDHHIRRNSHQPSPEHTNHQRHSSHHEQPANYLT